MIKVDFPTSKDIYIEINGIKLAIVESYKCHTIKESKYIEAFGQSEPVGCAQGKIKHYIELSKVYIQYTPLLEDINFYSLSNFNLVIIKPDRKIVYSGCEWTELNESGKINDTILQGVSLIASHRMEIS